MGVRHWCGLGTPSFMKYWNQTKHMNTEHEHNSDYTKQLPAPDNN